MALEERNMELDTIVVGMVAINQYYMEIELATLMEEHKKPSTMDLFKGGLSRIQEEVQKQQRFKHKIIAPISWVEKTKLQLFQRVKINVKEMADVANISKTTGQT